MALVFLLPFALITILLLLFTQRNMIKIKHNIQNEIFLFQKIHELAFIPARCAILIHNFCIS